MFQVFLTLSLTVSRDGDASDVRANLIAACSHVRWRQVIIGEDGQKTCSAVLASTSCGAQLRRRLSALTWDILDNP